MSEAKANAAKEALRFIEDGVVLGIGSGTTVEIFLELLGEKIRNEGLNVYGIPTSYQSHIAAIKSGVRVVDLFQYPEPDVCVDGADQIDYNFNCLKGGGAALMREKIVISASKKVIIIADETKYSSKLDKAIPIEVLPFAYACVVNRLYKIAKKVELRIAEKKLGPVITDNGNFIVDCLMEIDDVENLERDLNAIPGVVENGLFPSKLIDFVVLGNENGAKVLQK
ncbi:ribose 5-phosphate isomerase A [Archaeoglobales archaeon]|nr:MAG: ribose 5-phosphate isomerase A [Archaeoglobales archaeon]RLI79191.1 MAG: ribose 5-phosphate isomerase A [Archaeoglobales archaeon]